MPIEDFEVIINNASHSPRHAQSMCAPHAAEWNWDLFISPSTETPEAPSEAVYSSLLLQLNVPQAFSGPQIQLINSRLTGSGSKSCLEKAVSCLPCQGAKGPKTASCVCVPHPGNTGFGFGGQMQLLYNCWLPVVGGHRRSRRRE